MIFSTDPDLKGMVELASAGPIPREAALRLTCDAAAAVDGQPERRTASPALRRALERLRLTCDAEGCDAPASWCDVHHVEHFAEGGKTTLANSRLYCRRHHRQHHERERSKAPP